MRFTTVSGRRGRLLFRLPAVARPRRRSVALLVVGLAVGLAVPGIQRTAAQEAGPPRLVLEPSCGSPWEGDETAIPLIEIGARGHDFPPNSTVEIYFDAGELDRLADAETRTDAFGAFDVTLEVPQPTDPGAVTVLARDDRRSEATANYLVPCPASIAITPDCGPAVDDVDGTDPYQIRVEGEGFRREGGDVQIGFMPSDGSITATSTATPDPSGRFVAELVQPAWAAGTHRVVAAQGQLNLSAQALFRVPCPPRPMVFVAPQCGPLAFPSDRLELLVSGTGFLPDSPIEVIFDLDGSSQAFVAREVVNESGSWGPIAITPFGRMEGRYVVLARQTVLVPPFTSPPVARLPPSTPGVLVSEATAMFEVPCPPERDPLLAVDPPGCGPAAPTVGSYDIRVRGFNFSPGPVELTFDADRAAGPDYPSESFAATAGEEGSFVADIAPAARPSGTYRILARQATVDGPIEATAVFFVPCEAVLEPIIRIVPESGPPGYVAIVEGEGFPSNEPVALTWNRGINAGREMTLDAGDTGTFRVGILVFHHDFVGRRVLQAGVPGDPDAYRTATDEYLVVAGQGSPPVFSAPDGASPFGDPILIRR